MNVPISVQMRDEGSEGVRKTRNSSGLSISITGLSCEDHHPGISDALGGGNQGGNSGKDYRHVLVQRRKRGLGRALSFVAVLPDGSA